MLTLANLSNADSDLQRFADAQDVRTFLSHTGMDGFELLLYEKLDALLIPNDTVKGIHLGYFPSWLAFWRGDADWLTTEFGSLKEAYKYYDAENRQGMLDNLRKQLDFAAKVQAKYVVFHVAEVSLQETVDYRFHFTDEEVIDSAAELINELLEGRHDSFDFLVENLWWPGFRFTSPALTQRLMEQIIAPNKGIMLDTGHLLHTNQSLRSLEDACDYINQMMDAHGELCRYIRGVHLHQSLSGEYAQAMIRKGIRLKGTYMERLMASYQHIMHIDTHRPFLSPGIRGVIEKINPEYLVYELITTSREDHETCLVQQHAIFHQKEK